MPPVPAPHDPGSLTVPLWFGWQHVLTVVVIVAAVGIAAVVLLAVTGGGGGGHPEWQAWLEARSVGWPGPADDHEVRPPDEPAGNGPAEADGSREQPRTVRGR